MNGIESSVERSGLPSLATISNTTIALPLTGIRLNPAALGTVMKHSRFPRFTTALPVSDQCEADCQYHPHEPEWRRP